jgi:hypothetical protein
MGGERERENMYVHTHNKKSAQQLSSHSRKKEKKRTGMESKIA